MSGLAKLNTVEVRRKRKCRSLAQLLHSTFFFFPLSLRSGISALLQSVPATRPPFYTCDASFFLSSSSTLDCSLKSLCAGSWLHHINLVFQESVVKIAEQLFVTGKGQQYVSCAVFVSLLLLVLSFLSGHSGCA